MTDVASNTPKSRGQNRRRLEYILYFSLIFKVIPLSPFLGADVRKQTLMPWTARAGLGGGGPGDTLIFSSE